MSGFAVVKKALHHWKKTFMRKKPSSLFMQKGSSKLCSEVLLKYIGPEISFGDS